MPETDRLVWVDVETTGLNPDENLLLEVGFKITDLELNVQSQISLTMWDKLSYPTPCLEENLDPYVHEMHRRSDLIAEAKASGVTPENAHRALARWIVEQEVDKTDPLCGSSVQFDREWLRIWMPEVIKRFSYRNVDVSTIKELCKRYNPILYSELDSETLPMKMHRVLPDIDDTIGEFKFYRDNFLFWKD